MAETTALDEAMDHAATIGSTIRVSRFEAKRVVWFVVRLNDEASGYPEGRGATVEGAAGALMYAIDQHLEALRAALPFVPPTTTNEEAS